MSGDTTSRGAPQGASFLERTPEENAERMNGAIQEVLKAQARVYDNFPKCREVHIALEKIESGALWLNHFYENYAITKAAQKGELNG